MRRGELLNLTWQNVDLTRRTIKVRAETSKSRKMRVIPISARLAAVLEMARTDPAGREYGPADFVFGDVVGRKVKDTKKAWTTAVLKAHAQTPKWVRTGLSAESRAQVAAIDLHFHDLRHEAGSRRIEEGWPVHHVQEMLGHADLKQTSTYINVTFAGLEESMRRSDESRARCKLVASETAIENQLPCNDSSSVRPKVLVN